MIKAFWKLSNRDKFVLLVAAAVIITAAFSLVLFLMTGFFFNGIKFPGSSLISEKTTMQGHEVKEYGSLPVPVDVPGTGYGVSLAGKELPPSEHGAAFDAGEGLLTVAGYLAKSEDISVFAQNSIPEMVEGVYGMGSWQKKVYGKGYLNSVYAEYYGGIITTTTDSYYCLFYRYPGKLKDMVFGTVRGSASASTFRLTFDKRMVDRMFFTVVETGEVVSELPPLKEMDVDTPAPVSSGDNVPDSIASEAMPSEDASEAMPSEDASDSTHISEDDEEVLIPSREEELLEMRRNMKEQEFKCAYPGQEIFTTTAQVPEDLAGKEVGIELFFTQPDARIFFATIKNEKTGRVESATDLNEMEDGIVRFYIDNCESGTWTIEVERAQELGQFDVRVLSADLMRSLIEDMYDETKIQPRS